MFSPLNSYSVRTDTRAMNNALMETSDENEEEDHCYSIRIRSAPLLRHTDSQPPHILARSTTNTPIPLYKISRPKMTPSLNAIQPQISPSPVITQNRPPSSSPTLPSFSTITTSQSVNLPIVKSSPAILQTAPTATMEENNIVVKTFQIDSLLKDVRDLIGTVQSEIAPGAQKMEQKLVKTNFEERDPKQFASDKLFSRIKDLKENRLKFKILEQQINERKQQEQKKKLSSRKNQLNFIHENVRQATQQNQVSYLEDMMIRSNKQAQHIQIVKQRGEKLLEAKKQQWRSEIEKKYSKTRINGKTDERSIEEIRAAQFWMQMTTVTTYLDAIQQEMKLTKFKNAVLQREIDALDVIRRLFIPIIKRRKMLLMQRFVKAMKKNFLCFVINFRIRKKRKAATIIATCLKQQLQSSIFTSHVIKFMNKVRYLQKLFRKTTQVRKSQLLLLRLQYARVEKSVVTDLLRNDEEELCIKVYNEIQKLKNEVTNSTAPSKTKSMAEAMKQTSETVLEYKKKLKEIADQVLKDKKDKNIDIVLTMIQTRKVPFEELIKVGESVGMFIKRRVIETDDKIKEMLLYNNLKDRITYHYRTVQEQKKALESDKVKKRQLLRFAEKNLVKTPSKMLREMVDEQSFNDNASMRSSSKNSIARSNATISASEKIAAFRVLAEHPVMEALVRRGLELTEQSIKENVS